MGSQKTILVIDDAQEVRKILRFHLEQKGYLVYEAEDGEKGLALIRSKRPHLIVLDINMPKKTGIEVYKELYDSKEIVSCAVLMLTVREELGSMFIDLDVDGFVTKPFVIGNVLKEIDIIMKKRYGVNVVEKKEKTNVHKEVLIVEENEEAFATIAVEFLKEGYIVSFASSAVTAFEKITNELPDILVINLNTQDISGDSFVSKLKHMPKTMDLPMVLYTKYDQTLENTVMEKISDKVKLEIVKGNDPVVLVEKAKSILKGL
ncbi:MAG: response regulator [Candidatus Omnitrophica bacterium]|nr:response regulator [Candidatus Omnitrophota bacterium]